MKKMMFLLPVAAIAMASCSSDNLVEQQQSFAEQAASNGDLVFRPTINGATRGTVVTSSTLSAFDVNITGSFQEGEAWAEGAPVKTSIFESLTGSGSTWAFSQLTGSNKYWWNDKTTEATFTAVAPTDLLETASEGKIAYQPSSTVAEQKDLITAFESGTREDFTAGVPLTFKHALSQIVVNATNSENADVKIEVMGMRIKNVKSAGNLSLPTATAAAAWSDLQTEITYATGATTAAGSGTAKTVSTAASIMDNSPMLLLPQDLSANTNAPAISVLVKVTKLGSKVAKRDVNGQFTVSGTPVPFNAVATVNNETGAVTVDEPQAGETANAYIGTFKINEGGTDDTEKEALTKDGDVWTYTTYKEGTEENAGKLVVDQTYTLDMVDEVLFPREGRGNASEKYGYMYAPISTNWEMGKKYTYTLNYGVGKYGSVDSDLAAYGAENLATINYPYGVTDYGVGGEITKPYTPDEPIEDTPVELFFTTVTVEDWVDAAAETPKMD